METFPRFGNVYYIFLYALCLYRSNVLAAFGGPCSSCVAKMDERHATSVAVAGTLRSTPRDVDQAKEMTAGLAARECR
jgi:hypothetical protein